MVLAATTNRTTLVSFRREPTGSGRGSVLGETGHAGRLMASVVSGFATPPVERPRSSSGFAWCSSGSSEGRQLDIVDQAAPLMPPELWDVIDRCSTTKTWKNAKRPPEPDLVGLRDRALFLVGFVAALRRSEMTALTVAQIAEHPNGLVLSVARSKTNQTRERAELAVLPRARMASQARHRRPSLAHRRRRRRRLRIPPLFRHSDGSGPERRAGLLFVRADGPVPRPAALLVYAAAAVAKMNTDLFNPDISWARAMSTKLAPAVPGCVLGVTAIMGLIRLLRYWRLEEGLGVVGG